MNERIMKTWWQNSPHIDFIYEYKSSSLYPTTINVNYPLEWIIHNTMILFLNQYMTLDKRNEIVHLKRDIYK